MTSLLFNMLTGFVIPFLPRNRHLLISWIQSPSAVILEAKKIASDILPSLNARTSAQNPEPRNANVRVWHQDKAAMGCGYVSTSHRMGGLGIREGFDTLNPRELQKAGQAGILSKCQHLRTGRWKSETRENPRDKSAGRRDLREAVRWNLSVPG